MPGANLTIRSERRGLPAFANACWGAGPITEPKKLIQMLCEALKLVKAMMFRHSGMGQSQIKIVVSVMSDTAPEPLRPMTPILAP